MRDDFRRAVIAGERGRVEGLLRDGLPIDALDRYGQTALMLAAVHGREEVVASLLEAGARPDVTAKFGLSALMLAIVNHHEAIARQLIEAGADTSLRGTGAWGFAGKTAMDLAEAGGLTALADLIREGTAR